jgi:hypothetical protein
VETVHDDGSIKLCEVTCLCTVGCCEGENNAAPLSLCTREDIRAVVNFYWQKVLEQLTFTHVFVFSMVRPSLWSSGQNFWLQIQRFQIKFPALPDFLISSGSETGSVDIVCLWIKSTEFFFSFMETVTVASVECV